MFGLIALFACLWFVYQAFNLSIFGVSPCIVRQVSNRAVTALSVCVYRICPLWASAKIGGSVGHRTIAASVMIPKHISIFHSSVNVNPKPWGFGIEGFDVSSHRYVLAHSNLWNINNTGEYYSCHRLWRICDVFQMLNRFMGNFQQNRSPSWTTGISSRIVDPDIYLRWFAYLQRAKIHTADINPSALVYQKVSMGIPQLDAGECCVSTAAQRRPSSKAIVCCYRLCFRSRCARTCL